MGEVLQAMGMRRHGEIRDFRPGALGRAAALLARNRFVIGSVVAMAVSFFAFMGLLTIADLSFAVPATAVTYVLETILAKYVLKEQVNWRALGGRVAGDLRRGAGFAVMLAGASGTGGGGLLPAGDHCGGDVAARRRLAQRVGLRRRRFRF